MNVLPLSPLTNAGSPIMQRLGYRKRDPNDLSAYINSTYSTIPPELATLVSEYPHLKKMAELLITKLYTFVDHKPSEEEIQLIDTGFRHLVESSMKIRDASTTSNKLSGNIDDKRPRANSYTPSEISSMKIQLNEIQTQNQVLSNLSQEQQSEFSAMQEEIEDLYKTKNNLNLKISEMKRRHENKLSEKSVEKARLNDQLQDALGKIKLLEEAKESLEKQLEAISEDNNQQSKEYIKIQEKLSEKKEKIGQLKISLRQAELSAEKLQLQNKRLKMEVKTSDGTLSTLDNEKELNKYQKQINRLTKYTEKQTEDISDLTKANHEISDMLETQTRLIQQREKNLLQAQKSIGEYENKINTMEQHVQKLETTNKKNNERLSELVINNSRMDEILKSTAAVLDSSSTIPYEQIPAMCSKIISSRPMNEQTDILCGMVDGLTRFITQLIQTEEPNLQLLSKSNPIKNDSSLKADLLQILAKNQEYVQEVCTGFNKVKLFDGILTYNQQTKKMIDEFMVRPTNSAYSALVILLVCIQKINNRFENAQKQLNQITSRVPKENASYNDAVEYLKALQLIHQRITNNSQSENPISIFTTLYEDFTNLSFAFDKKLRQQLNFQGELRDFPTYITETVLSLKKESVETKKEANQQIEATKTECESKIKEAQTRSTIYEFNDATQMKIQELEEKLKKTVEALEDANESRVETEEAFAAFHQNHSEAQENHRIVVKERDRLMKLLKERAVLYQTRIESALAFERERHETDVKRIERKHIEQQQLLSRQLEAKNKKITSMKEHHKEIIESYESMMKNQQEEMKQLIDQNERLISTIAQGSHKADEKTIQKLQRKIAELTIQRSKELAPQKVLMATKRDNELQVFVQELGKVIDPTTNGWTRQKILDIISKDKQAVSSDEWNEFAIQTLESIGAKNAKRLDPRHMMKAIKEIISVSSCRYRTLSMIQSLRFQKRILQTQSIRANSNNGPVTMRDVIRTVLSIISIQKTAVATKKHKSKSKKSRHISIDYK